MRNIQVVADKDNNTLLIVATAQEYRIIEAALKKLDVPPRQVAIEVTIASVALTDDLEFGVDWLFKGGAPSGRGSGGNVNGLAARRRSIRRSRWLLPPRPPPSTQCWRSRRASTTSSTTRISPAACRRRCTCSISTATRR